MKTEIGILQPKGAQSREANEKVHSGRMKPSTWSIIEKRNLIMCLITVCYSVCGWHLWRAKRCMYCYLN